MVDRTELLLLDKGFHQIRVRIHDKRAKIEIMPEEAAEMTKIVLESYDKELHDQRDRKDHKSIPKQEMKVATIYEG